MSTANNSHRSTLRNKISGPNALPIAKLVARGDGAALRVQNTIDDFLRQSIRRLEEMHAELARAETHEAWMRFFTLVHDIRGSSALAGKVAISTFCASFETLLQGRDAADPRVRIAIVSHINALNLVMAGRVEDEKSEQLLAAQLSRAVDCLPVRKRDLRAMPAGISVT